MSKKSLIKYQFLNNHLDICLYFKDILELGKIFFDKEEERFKSNFNPNTFVQYIDLINY